MRLTIELVPSTCWNANVRTLVTKAEWDRIRKKVYAAADFACEACGRRGTVLHAHEKWAYDDQTHRQVLEDMVALCPGCHEVKHLGFAQTQGRGDQARTHLAKVNGWALAQADAYILQQFKLWEERSRVEWTIDTSALARYS